MTATLETLLAMDERLATRGKPRVFAPGSFWLGEAEAFYGSKAAEWWAQVGRGGAKSTVMYRIAQNETLFGAWAVPAGERHWATIKSRSKEEAAKALGIIASDLEALGVRYRVAGDCLELEELPRGIRITAASVGGTSGWRSFFDGNDEIAKWPRDGAVGVDAREVVASGRAMTVTHARSGARRLYFSTPFGMEGPHYEAVERGTGDGQHVSVAASWVANPIITEDETHALEKDARIWSREYAAIPQAGVLAAFNPDLVDEAFDPARAVGVGWARCRRVLLLDPTAGASDAYAFASVGWRLAPKGHPQNHRLEFSRVGGFDHASRRGYTSDQMVGLVAQVAREEGCSSIHADQFERYALASAFSSRGFRYVAHTWTAPLKERAVEHVRRWLSDGVLALPKHDRMRKELHAFEERLAPSGALTFRGRQGSHDDYAMLVVLAALVDIENGLPGSPIFAAERRAMTAKVERLARYVNEGPPDEQELRALTRNANVNRRARPDVQDRIAESHVRELAAWDEYLRRIGSPAATTKGDATT